MGGAKCWRRFGVDHLVGAAVADCGRSFDRHCCQIAAHSIARTRRFDLHVFREPRARQVAISTWRAAVDWFHADNRQRGSAGPEGPIVTIGATIGSSLGRLLKTDPQSTATLLGCGAAAGLASVFAAPMAGIFFVLEVILRDFSVRTFTPIVVAAVISVATTQMVLGTNQPLFGVGPEIFGDNSDVFTVVQTPEFIVLGLVCGIVAVGFGTSLRRMERFFHNLKVPNLLKPAIGALALVVIGIAFYLFNPMQATHRRCECCANVLWQRLRTNSRLAQARVLPS